MNPILEKTLKLGLICGVAALLLGVVNSVTEPVIQERKERELREALTALVPCSTVLEPLSYSDQNIITVYPIDIIGDTQGMILSMTARGYAGPMSLIAAYDMEGELLNAQLLENQETPGLGKKAEDPQYMEKFIGRGAEIPLPQSREDLDPEMDDVTGATITFNGLSEQLYLGSQWVKSRRD